MAGVGDFEDVLGSGNQQGRERALVELATRQHGVVSHRQLVELGLRPRGIQHRVAAARLHRVHVGVYAVGHTALAPPGRLMAAVLAYPGAVLSDRSAGLVWGLRDSASSEVDVTVPGRRGRGRPGIRLHRSTRLNPEDVSLQDGIPVTSVPRTLLDLAETLHPTQLERAYEQAERLRLLDVRAVERLCERSPGRRGLRPLRELLIRDPMPDAIRTRSELERRFLDVCRDARLPRPELNVCVCGFEVDAVWLRERVIVELDGYAFHRTRAAFERDRQRDAALQAAGYRVIRVTHRRLMQEPEVVAAELRALLALASD